MDGELLGRAVLELTTDQRPLDRGLASAERRVAISAAAMQSTLDRSSRQAGATLDKQLTPPITRVGTASYDMGRKVESSLAGVDAKAQQARSSLDKVHSSLLEISRTMPPAAQLGALSAIRDNRPVTVGGRDRGAIVGARGAAAPGSRQNPIVVVLEAGKYTGLGALAAAIGQPDSSHQAPSAPPVVNISGVETKFSDTQYDGLIAALSQRQAPAGGGGGGGARVPPVALGGGGGGGGDNRSILSRVGFGGGIAGLAGAGTAASFAGLGFEHLITTLLSVAGSAARAGVGGGALALGSLGKLAVGGGSDIAVLKSTITDTQTLAKSVGSLTTAQSKAKVSQQSFNQQLAALHNPTLSADYKALQDAQAKYGAGSAQAAKAQTTFQTELRKVQDPALTASYRALQSAQRGSAAAQAALNAQIAALGGTAGVKAEVLLAKNAQALNKFWDLQTSQARVAATNILEQIVTLGHDFVPLIAGAAQRNLSIINTSLRPLFAWLEGPQGIQIFNDLENRFARDLPTAVHAFTQGIELLMRIVDIASAHTGGFIHSVDHLLTRLNAMDNAQLGAGIQRFINEFRLWSSVVKLLGEDIFLLFHQDVGTGTALVQALDKMLLKLHAYESSARGQAQLQSIFMLHKTEVLALVHVLGLLGGAFAHIYLAVAPQLVSIMNDAVIPVLKAVASVISDIAKHSSFAALLLGLGLISAKAFGISKTVGALRSLTQWLLGTGPAAKAGMTLAASEAAVATGGGAIGAGAAGGGLARLGARAGAGVEAGGLAAGGALERVGLGGAGAGVVGAAGAIAPIVTATLPLLLAGGAGILIAKFLASTFNKPLNLPQGSTPQDVTRGLQGRGGGFAAGNLTNQLRQQGAFGFGNEQSFHLQGKSLQVVGDMAKFSTGQLQGLTVALKHADSVKLNGVDVSRTQLLKLAQAALKTRTDWNRSFNDVWRTINTFATGAGPVLAALKDRFATNMRLIAHELGTNSNAGRKAVAHNIQMMVSDLQLNMAEGRISVHDGMNAIRRTLDTGMKDEAISWRTEWTDMFTTVTDLYKEHKINTKTYLSDVRSITKTGWGHIRDEVQASLDKQKADLKVAYDHGKLSNHDYHVAIHKAEQGANRTEQTDMAAFASHVIDGMVAAGIASGKGTDAIIGPLNTTLKALGAKPVSSVGITVAGVTQQIAGAVKGVTHGLFGASGGLWQIGQPGQAGHDTVPLNVGGTRIMVAPGEQAAVFNRHQIPEVNARFADWGGLGGYFAGNTKPNYMAGGGWVRTGATIDPTQGQAPTYSAHGGFSFAELLEAGTNAGMRPDVTQLLGLPRAGFGMPMETAIDIRMPGSKRSFQIWKNDVGSGQPGNPHYTVDLHQAIASALGWGGNADVEIARAGTDPNAAVTSTGGAIAAAIQQLVAPKVTGTGATATIVRGALKKVTDAANAYLQAHAPAPSAGGSFSGALPGGHIAGGGKGAYSAVLPVGRVDQGLDFTGAGPVGAILDGTIMRTDAWPGWPGTGRGLVYSTAQGNVYVVEHVIPSVSTGQHVTAGQQIATVLPGYPWLETGWANAAGTGPLTPYNGAADGTPMPGGIAFKRFLGYGAGGMIPGLASGGTVAPVTIPYERNGRLLYPHNMTQWVKDKKHHKYKTEGKGKHKGFHSVLKHWKPPKGAEKLDAAFKILADPQAFLDGTKDPFSDWVTALDNQDSLIGSILGETDAAGNPHATLLGGGPLSDIGLLNPKPGNLTNIKGIRWPTFAAGSSAYDAEALNRMTEIGVLGGKVSSETGAASILARAIKDRKDRQKGITTFLKTQDKRRVKLQAQRDHVQQAIRDLTSKDLRKRLAAAISATDVGKRIADAKGREGDAQSAMDYYQTLIKDERAKGKLANHSQIADWTRLYGKEKRSRDDEKTAVGKLQKHQPTSVSSAMAKIAKNDLSNENTLLGKELAKVGDVLSEFGGSRTKVGTGGLTGTITTDLKTLGDGLKGFQDDIATTMTSTIPGLDLSLRDIASSKLGASAGATDNSQLASLLQQQLTQANQALAVSQAQYGVLANLPPYVGSYDKTGIVPGAMGAPMLATVHGGEIIAKQASSSMAERIEVIVLDGAVDQSKIRVIANGEAVKVTRGMARGAGRPLAGAGGGLFRS